MTDLSKRSISTARSPRSAPAERAVVSGRPAAGRCARRSTYSAIRAISASDMPISVRKSRGSGHADSLMVQGGVSAVRAVSASDSPISDGLTSGAAALALVCNLWFVDSASAAGHGDAPRGYLSAYISITNIKSSVICVLKSGSFCAPYRAETQRDVLAVPAYRGERAVSAARHG